MNKTKIPTCASTMLAIAVSFTLSGCATTQNGSPFPTLQPLSIEVSDVTDALSPRMRQLKKLVGEGKMADARSFFNSEHAYFSKRLKPGQPVPRDVETLTNFVWTSAYKPAVDSVMRGLSAVQDVSSPQTWPETRRLFEEVSRIRLEMVYDKLLDVTKVGVADRDAMEVQRKRINDLALAHRQAALRTTYDVTLATGQHPAAYIGADFGTSDYQLSADFQERARTQITATGDRAEIARQAQLLGKYLSAESKQAVDQRYVEVVRREIMPDGQTTLEGIFALGSSSTPFGTSKKLFANAAKIAHVHLANGRAGLEFELKTAADLDFDLVAGGGSLPSEAELSQYDYVFVTDARNARIAREFKSRREQASRMQTGTRQVPNPGYVQAMSNHQKAMTEYQRTQISGAIPKLCQGWGCALQGLADGLSEGAARSNVDRAANQLAQTPQTLTEPIYEPYSYQLVDISTVRTAEVSAYVIDVRRKRAFRTNEQLVDKEVFTVAYNVRDQDPNRSSILQSNRSEDDVAAWEKRPFSMSLRKLFTREALVGATQTGLPEFRAFLTSANAKSTSAELARTAALKDAARRREPPSATIADDRFDSIVILKTAKASGTAFYVTPDLLLTTYHVVQGTNLVEVIFYDGRKTMGQVIDHDVRLDLAVIRPQISGKPLRIHDGPIKLGETVEAIGHPKGFDFTITRGVISALRKQKSINIGSSNLVEFVQTDTPISQGNSGGPLLMKDVVIGVNDWTRIDKGSQNLNFSVSFNEVREYLARVSAK